MTSATLALSNGLARLPNHLKFLLWTPSSSPLKTFSTSFTTDGEETPAMTALKAIPYPSASPDPSIFESWSDEYSRVPLPRAARSVEKPTPSTSLPHHPSAALERLSWTRKFVKAEEVRKELLRMGMPIRYSLAYRLPAWDVLRQRPWPPNRAERFANWLSLLPDIPENKKSGHVNLLKSTLLFSSSNLDLQSVAHFGVILSSKGYIRSIGAPVIAFLTRYADPEASSRVLDEMVAADDDHKRNKLGLTKKAETRFKDTSKRLWSIVVRTHCSTGRPKVAFQVAKRVQERNIPLTQYTYQYLLGKLEDDGLHEHAAEIRALPDCKSLDVAKSRFKDTPTPEPILPISPNQRFDTNKALALATLKQSSFFGLPTYATDIVPYFDLYKTRVWGGPAVIELRSQAYKLSLAAVSAVLLAELLHHHRRGQFTHVLWVFEKFFHAASVPAAEVTRRLWKRDHYPPNRRLHIRTLPSYITDRTFNLPSKLWPTSYHTALVWTALVQLCDNEEEVFALYEQLLQRSAGQFPRQTHHHHHHHHHHHNNNNSADGFSRADRYDAAHFRPFLVANTLLRGPEDGLRVLNDMQDRGIAPSGRILGTFAALQARHGEPATALHMLAMMHDVLEERERARSQQQQQVCEEWDADADADVDVVGLDSVHHPKSESALRRARTQVMLVVAHTAVLRGLADRRTLVPARQVAEMLREKFGYSLEGSDADADATTGENPRTNAALRFLRRLEVEGPGAMPDPADSAILAKSMDDWQQERYSYPFLKRDSKVIKVLNAGPGSNR